LTAHIISLFYQDVFKKFGSKYNIYRDLYSLSLLGLEIRNLPPEVSENVRKIILLNKEICYYRPNQEGTKGDLLILGNFEVFSELAKEILASGNEDLGYRIKKTISNCYGYENNIISLFADDPVPVKTKVMGILNVTPDSFSDKGKYAEIDAAVEHALQMLDEGADIIDIGGESTRPDSKGVPEEEELNRVIPVIKELIKARPAAILSLDTTKAKVAEEGIKNGVKIINDISAFSFEENILKVVSDYNVSYVLMHMKGIPENMQENPYYNEVVSEVYDFLVAKIKLMKKYGLKNIIIDPGIGFGKRVSDNYELLRRLAEFKGIGCPLLIGLSNKSFLGKSLNLNVEERVEATLSAETIAILNGAKFIRTHNVKNAVKAREITSCLLRPELMND
jgi:dihydropteroate synthase